MKCPVCDKDAQVHADQSWGCWHCCAVGDSPTACPVEADGAGNYVPVYDTCSQNGGVCPEHGTRVGDTFIMHQPLPGTQFDGPFADMRDPPARPLAMLAVWGGMFIAGAAFWYGVYRLIVWAIMLPTVYESYEGGYCVRVDDPRGVYTCENLPRKHYHQWTQ